MTGECHWHGDPAPRSSESRRHGSGDSDLDSPAVTVQLDPVNFKLTR